MKLNLSNAAYTKVRYELYNAHNVHILTLNQGGEVKYTEVNKEIVYLPMTGEKHELNWIPVFCMDLDFRNNKL